MTVQANAPYSIIFAGGKTAQALYVPKTVQPAEVITRLGLSAPTPAIFLTGGAGGMSDEDIRLTEQFITTLAQFAQEYGATVIDGGTQSGIMQMMGQARSLHSLTFPLIGIAPLSKVEYPGYINPAKDAELNPDHTHFVFIEGNEWGDESELILGLTRALAAHMQPEQKHALGVLINGGKIARKEVYLAATKELHIPMIIIEGSGRAADEIATAMKTGRTSKRILQMIIAGGDIQLVGTMQGPGALRTMLESKFRR
jgi:hypothetical protein